MSTYYNEYYVNQAGSGVGSIYRGSVYQKGSGFGSFFKGLFRSVMPLIKCVLKTIGLESLRSGSHILSDIANERPVADAFKSHVVESAENFIRKAENKIEKLVGSGKLKRKHKSSKNQKRSVRRKVNNTKCRDLFT